MLHVMPSCNAVRVVAFVMMVCQVQANECMVGIIYFDCYAGRPGEWSRLPKAKVEHMINLRGQDTIAACMYDDHVDDVSCMHAC